MMMRKEFDLVRMRAGIAAACIFALGSTPLLAATQLVDDFTRADNNTVGNGWTESESAAGVSAIRVGSNALQLYYAGTAGNGREFAYRDVSSLYQTTFNSAGTTLEWVFNMRQGRPTPSGYASGTYGAAFILGCTAVDPQNGNGNGYAVIIGETGTADTPRLVKFTTGLNADADWTSLIAQSPVPTLTDYFSIKVTFNPSTGQWELFTRTDGTTAFSDPTTGAALTSRGTATDTTYTGSNLKYLGCYWNHANGAGGAGNGATFDNINVPNLLSAEPTVQASTIVFSSVLTSQMNVSWTSGDGANRLVICRSGSAPSSGPVDATSYTADADFSGAGSSLGGGKVVYSGSGNSFTLTGLSPSTTYYLQVYEFNGSGGTANYLTSTASGNPNSQATAAPANSTASDIIRAAAFTEPSNIDYGSYQATDITSGNSIEVARFTIRDGGGSADGDSASTTLSAINFNVSNSSSLRRVALYDGTTEIAEVAGGSTLTFSGLSGLVAADGGTKDLSLRATFVASVTDNEQFQFTISSATADAGGSTFAAANAGGAASATTSDRNRIEVTATKLIFTSVPSAVNVDQNFTASVVARDANDNLDLDSTASVTVSKASGNGTLSGGSAQNLVSGAYSFTSLQISATGSFTIQAAASGLTTATSGSIVSIGRPLAISGYLPDPNSTDAPYEYVQVIALEDIDFSATPMCLVWNNNGTATANGWVAGGTLTYKFNITSGSLTAGQVAYVGGSGKLINGAGSTDISGETWLRAINNSTTAGDDFGSSGSSLGNGGANADGIALFIGTAITDTSVPVDAVFFGTGAGTAVVSAGADGYTLPVNDLYSGGYLQTASTILATPASATFQKLNGVYNTLTRTWSTARTLSTVLSPSTTGDIATGIILTAPATEPTVQASGISFSSVQSTQMGVTWTSGNGANRLVICRSGSAPSSGPVDASTYTADADFSGSGSALGGGKVVYIGSGNSFTLTGLAASTTYYLQVYEYNGTGVNVNYLTSTASGNPNSQITAAPPNSSQSDIVRASGFTEPSNIAYSSYQASDITDVNSIELARFTIRDGGASADADAFSTALDAIGFTIANGGLLRRVAIYDGTTEIAEVAGGASITFSGPLGLAAADGGTKDFSVRATFNSSVTDNQQLQITVNSASAVAGASLFAAANAGGASSDTTSDRNRIEVTATKLAFSSYTSTVTINQNFSASVQARDALENVDLDDTTSVTIIKGSGSGTLSGGSALALSSGAQTWSSLQIDTAGTFTLQASGGSLSAAASGTISAFPGPTTLAAGDIVVIGYNTVGPVNDDFAILVTKDLGPGTIFYVNDNEIATAGGATFTDLGEVEASFTVKAGQVIPAGTVIVLPWGAGAVSTTTYDWSSTSGAGLGNNNEEIYIYTATSISANTPSAFIYGVAIGSSTSARASGLTAGTTWITPPPSGGSTASRYKTTGATYYTATTNALLAAIGNVPVNWESAATYTLADTDWTFAFLAPASEPTVQASDISFSDIQSVQMDVLWTPGNGANRLVVCRQGSAPSAAPVDGTAYTADANFSGSGSSLGGGKVVYIGSGTEFTMTGLSPSTTYYLQIYEFNGSASTINYLTSVSSANPNSTTTDTAGNSASSDIARSSGFTEPENIDYAAYQATDITSGNSIEFARFTIRDGGGGADADALATILQSIVFSVPNSTSLRRVALYDGSTELAEVAGGSTLTFSSFGDVTVADDGTKDISLRATFNSTVTDNQQIQFTITSVTAANGYSAFAAANGGGASSSTTADRNRIEVTATKLVFSSVPANAGVAASFTAVVQARDANENVDLDNTASVTITKASGNGTLSGGGAQNLVSGAQTWSSLQVDTSGTVTLQASGGSLTDATSGSIIIANLLDAGDAAFVAFNADGNGDFAIVFFKNVDANTVLYFTDNSWNGTTLTTTEGTLTWNSGGSLIASGTVVRFTSASVAGRSVSVGSISGSGSFNLGGSGEGLFCYRGSSATTPSAFIAAIGNDTVASAFGSLAGTGLTDGSTAIRLTSGTDIGQYNGARSGYSVAGYLTLLNNMSNWDLQDASGDQSTDGTVPDIPFSATSFSFSAPATEPTAQASGINFSSVLSTQMNVAWTSGNGANRLVIARASGAPSSGPVDSTTYTADANFAGAGSSLGGGKVVYIGSGNSFTLTGLDASTTYYLEVYEYNGAGGTINYLTSTAAGNPNSQATTASGISAESDIVRAGSFTEPANVAYASYQATDITDVNSIELARFTIRDGSGATDSDSADTTLTSLSLTIVNGNRLRRLAIYDGTTEIAEVAGGASVSFSGLTGLVAPDNGTKDFSIRATFNASVTDNLQLQFTVASAAASLSGSTFASIDAGGAATDISGDANRIEVAATKLVFSYAQSPVLVGQNFTASVQARDANENIDLDSSASVSIARTGGTGALTGGDAQSLTSGQATWTLQIDTAGSFSLLASGGALTDGLSGTITATTPLAAGDLALIGRINNGTPDSYAIAALASIPAGTVVYFTDNAWNAGAFRGGATDGDGNETLSRILFNSTVPAGTIIRTDVSDARWSWTFSGSIPFGGSATYSALSLATGGDQIYAFQAANLNTNPLAAASGHIFVLDDTAGFEDADSSSQGNIPPGLSSNANTAISFPFGANNVIGLDMELAAAQNFATKSEWLAFIAERDNWTTTASTLPSGGLAFGLACPAGTPPRIASPGNQTITVGSLSTFTVTANDPGCYGVSLSVTGLPTGATFDPVGSGTNTVGTFSWNPNLGQDGTYVVRFIATDSGLLTTSTTIRVYVRAIGESTNASGVPLSQTNWVVEINDIPPSGGNGDVTFTATPGIAYDVYYSDSAAGGAMTWVKANTVVAADTTASAAVGEDSSRFFQVVPSGESAVNYGFWGVIKPTVVPGGGLALVSPPLRTDLNMQGDLGSQMAASLTTGSKVLVMSPGASPTWTEFTKQANGSWLRTSGAGSYTLNAGQAFFVQTAGSETSVRIAGQVGNDSTKQNTLQTGYNLIGISEGKTLAASTAFNSASPIGDVGGDETLSDQVIVQNPDGSWRRLIRRSNGTWYDTANPNSTANTTLQLTPGQAYYYIRRGGSTPLTF